MRSAFATGCWNVLLGLVLAAAFAVPGHAAGASTGPTQARPAAPIIPRGKALAVYAPLRPIVALFGDPLHAEVIALVDRERIDLDSVRLHALFKPFEARISPPSRRDFGHVTQLRWRIELTCLTVDCVPVDQAFRLFKLGSGRVYYRLEAAPGRLHSRIFRRPSVELLSRINPQVFASTEVTAYAYHLNPLPAVSYRATPWLPVGAALGLAGLLAACGILLAVLHVRSRRPPRSEEPAVVVTPLERALAFLLWAEDHGDDVLRRKALERLAAELDGRPDGLAAEAKELAWAEAAPQREQIEALAERVRREALP